MAGSMSELVRSRAIRAEKDLEDAELLLKTASFNSSVNRSYYAIFHAVRAVNAMDGFDSSKHSGVIAHFNQAHVASGDFPKEVSKIIQKAFHARSRSDYDDFYEASEEEAAAILEDARIFVRKAEEYLKEKNSI